MIDEWVKKLYIYTMEYHSAIKRNESESALVGWMNLEPVTQSEVSQKEKNKCHILMHIYGIYTIIFKQKSCVLLLKFVVLFV